MKIHNLKNIILTLIVVCSVLFSLSCDRMKSAVKASARISKQVENLVEQNEKSFNAGLYDKATALKIAEFNRKAIPAARAFNQAVRELKNRYANQTPPRSEFDRLAELFYAIESPFKDVLVTIGTLSPEQSALISSAIATIREAINLIRDSFSLAEIHYRENQLWQTQTI